MPNDKQSYHYWGNLKSRLNIFSNQIVEKYLESTQVDHVLSEDRKNIDYYEYHTHGKSVPLNTNDLGNEYLTYKSTLQRVDEFSKLKTKDSDFQNLERIWQASKQKGASDVKAMSELFASYSKQKNTDNEQQGKFSFGSIFAKLRDKQRHFHKEAGQLVTELASGKYNTAEAAIKYILEQIPYDPKHLGRFEKTVQFVLCKFPQLAEKLQVEYEKYQQQLQQNDNERILNQQIGQNRHYWNNQPTTTNISPDQSISNSHKPAPASQYEFTKHKPGQKNDAGKVLDTNTGNMVSVEEKKESGSKNSYEYRTTTLGPEKPITSLRKR